MENFSHNLKKNPDGKFTLAMEQGVAKLHSFVLPTVTPTMTPTMTPTITPTITPTMTPTMTSSVTPSITPSQSFVPDYWNNIGITMDGVGLTGSGDTAGFDGSGNTYSFDMLQRVATVTNSGGFYSLSYSGRSYPLGVPGQMGSIYSNARFFRPYIGAYGSPTVPAPSSNITSPRFLVAGATSSNKIFYYQYELRNKTTGQISYSSLYTLFTLYWAGLTISNQWVSTAVVMNRANRSNGSAWSGQFRMYRFSGAVPSSTYEIKSISFPGTDSSNRVISISWS